MMDCSKSHSKCQASCCGIVPIPKEIYDRNKDKIITQPAEIKEFSGPDLDENLDMRIDVPNIDIVVPITKNLRCPFLNVDTDLSCNIYEDRPRICRKFGDETHPQMTCIFQDKNGRCRSRQETRMLTRKLEKRSLTSDLNDVLKVLP